MPYRATSDQFFLHLKHLWNVCSIFVPRFHSTFLFFPLCQNLNANPLQDDYLTHVSYMFSFLRVKWLKVSDPCERSLNQTMNLDLINTHMYESFIYVVFLFSNQIWAQEIAQVKYMIKQCCMYQVEVLCCFLLFCFFLFQEQKRHHQENLFFFSAGRDGVENLPESVWSPVWNNKTSCGRN